MPLQQPALLKGAFQHWPLVQKNRQSLGDLIAYLLQFDAGAEVEAFVAPPASGGQYFYQTDLRSFNFQKIRLPFENYLTRLCLALAEPMPPGIYMGSTPAEHCLPGLMAANPCHLLAPQVAARVWLGNKSVVQPHFDVSHNIAVVAAGRRRFTLFPPEQIDNLYIGPLDVTPAGQPMSMVDLRAPDLQRYPRYKIALQQAQVAELEPGDALFIPPLWWHGVEGLEPFNLLVNYWWSDSPAHEDDAFTALIHGVLAIAALPAAERQAWKHFFDHYVFQSQGNPLAHLPPAARGVLGERTAELQQLIRQYLQRRMK